MQPSQPGGGLTLLLPEWSSPEGFDCHKLFERQREKLQDAFQLIFCQADHCRYQRISIFTNGIRVKDFAHFPVEDIAEATLNALHTAELDGILDVYICDTASSLVFKAFEYMFPRYQLILSQSHENDWEVVSSEGE